MTYIALYIFFVSFIWWGYRLGWAEALKKIISILIPSILIIFVNIRFSKLILSNPLIGLISVLPTAVIVYKYSKPTVDSINSWIDRKRDQFVDSQDIVDADVISNEDV